MKKKTKILLVAMMLLFLFGCSDRRKENENTADQPSEASENKEVEKEPETTEDLTDYKTAPFKATCGETIKIRSTPSTSGSVKGYVRKGDYFEVYETKENEGYVWNRIGPDAWIANDGTWLKRVSYDTEFKLPDCDLLVLKELPNKIEGTFYSTSGGSLYTKGNETYTISKDTNGMISKVMRYQNVESNYLDENLQEHVEKEERTDELWYALRFGVSPFLYQNNTYNNETVFKYDDHGNLTYVGNKGNLSSTEYTYNSNDKLISTFDTYHNDDYTTSRTYTYKDGLLVKIEQSSADPTGDEFSNGVMEINELEYNGNLIFCTATYAGMILDDTDYFFRIDDKGRIIEEYEIHMGWHDWLYSY